MENTAVNDLIHAHSADAMTPALEIAGVGARSYAFVIDWHIRLLLALAWIYSAVFLFYDLSIFQTIFDEAARGNTAVRVIFIPAAIVYFFYHPVLETVMRGCTPGKRTAGVRLITVEGHTPGASRILVRNILRLVDSLPGVYTVGLLCAMLTRNHVRIGDIAAGTVLVYERRANEPSLSGAARRPPDSKLSAEQYDLLLELLERWQQLDKKQRVQLGQRFLGKIGDDFVANDSKQIRSRLQQLAGR